ncbi:MAG: hypothetical protein WC777_02205 [Candidatus Gracilibacteria bacterium]|jgi:hypothetical protein
MSSTTTKLKVRIPHIVLDVRGADPALVDSLTPGLEELPARFHILGGSGKSIPHVFSLEEALEEAHIWVVLSPKLPPQFSMIVDHGIVPVMLQGLHKDAENYNPVEESGNAILFQKLGVWNIHAALVRVIENFAFVYDWENLRSQGKALMKI